MKKTLRKTRGITLIALVVTIIVLLVLAGVTISMIPGDNGILNKVIKAKQKTEEANILEMIRLSTLSSIDLAGEVDFDKLEIELENYFSQRDFYKKKSPDKYIVKVDNVLRLITKTGEIISIEEINKDSSTDSIDLNEDKAIAFYNLKIYGQSEQNETGILSVGDKITDENDSNYNKYKIKIKARGKNLFNIESPKRDKISYITINKIENGFKYIVGSNQQYSSYASYKIDNEDVIGKTITLSADFKLSDNNKAMLRLGYWNKTSNSFNSPGSTFKEINSNERVSVNATVPTNWPNANGDNYDLFFNATVLENMKGATLEVTNIQVEVGSQATDYEQYYEPQIYTIYLDAPLRKIDDVSDYIDFRKGKIIRYVKEENGVLSKLNSPNEENFTLPYIELTNMRYVSVITNIKPSKVNLSYFIDE